MQDRVAARGLPQSRSQTSARSSWCFRLRGEDGCWRDRHHHHGDGSHLGGPLTHFAQKLWGIWAEGGLQTSVCEQATGVGGHSRCEHWAGVRRRTRQNWKHQSLRVKSGGCAGHGGEAWETPDIRSVSTRSPQCLPDTWQLDR